VRIGNVERVTETYETRALGRRIDIQTTRQKRRLIGDDPDGAPIHARESDHDVARPVLLHFEKFAVIGDVPDRILDVVG
jgi:hypothetical protein